MSGNFKPRELFIGSSRESLHIAHKAKEIINSAFQGKILATVWEDTEWRNLTSALENLDINLDKFYYALFIGYPDDIIYFRNKCYYTTRDNVVFELGLFLTRLGKERTFFAIPERLSYNSQITLQMQKLSIEKELDYRLISDVGENRTKCRILFEYVKKVDEQNNSSDFWEANNGATNKRVMQ